MTIQEKLEKIDINVINKIVTRANDGDERLFNDMLALAYSYQYEKILELFLKCRLLKKHGFWSVYFVKKEMALNLDDIVNHELLDEVVSKDIIASGGSSYQVLMRLRPRVVEHPWFIDGVKSNDNFKKAYAYHLENLTEEDVERASLAVATLYSRSHNLPLFAAEIVLQNHVQNKEIRKNIINHLRRNINNVRYSVRLLRSLEQAAKNEDDAEIKSQISEVELAIRIGEEGKSVMV